MFKHQKNSVALQPLPISPEHRDYLKHVRRQKIMVRFTQVFILILAFGLWEICAACKFVDPFITSQGKGRGNDSKKSDEFKTIKGG